MSVLQYYMPLLNGTKKRPPKYRLEYLTFAPALLHPTSSPNANTTTTDGDVAKKAWHPIPLRHLPRSLRNSTVTKSGKYAPYRMEDLTIGSWLKLARKLGKGKNEKLRKKFRKYMYMGADKEL